MTHAIFGLPVFLIQEIGWTLIQFLWQGLALAAGMEIALSGCRSPVARHNCAFTTLVMMVVAPAVTFATLHGQSGPAPAFISAIVPNSPNLEAVSPRWLEGIVVAWLTGISTLTIRALGGWCVAESLRREDTSFVSADLLFRFRALQQRVAISRPVRYLQSARVSAPVLIGCIKPVILIPAAAVTGLPASQLEALIVHELAHIRRLDPVVNFVLIAAETILFYHPAVWWVTRRIRIERENCCGDVSVSVCGDPALFAEALLSLHEVRAMPPLAIASNGGKLKQRIARLLGTAPEAARFSLPALCSVLLICGVVGTIAAAQVTPRFSIRIIDETIAANSAIAPAGDDCVPAYKPGTGTSSAFWLRRQGAIDGDVVSEAHVTTGPDGKPIILFTLTPEGRDQFAALSRANVGRRAAVVINGVVVASPKIREPMLGGKAQISGNYTPTEADVLASEMTGAASPAR